MAFATEDCRENHEAQAAFVTDEDLMTRFATSGDREAFETLTHRYERELLAYLRRYLGQAEDAQDALQETLCKLFTKRNTWEPGRRVRPWLLTIATHTAIDVGRQRSRHRRHIVPLASLEGSAAGDAEQSHRTKDFLHIVADPRSPDLVHDMQRERREGLLNALEMLPEGQRLLIHLVYDVGLKYREAAERLNVPIGTIKSRLHAAIAALCAALTDEEERKAA